MRTKVADGPGPLSCLLGGHGVAPGKAPGGKVTVAGSGQAGTRVRRLALAGPGPRAEGNLGAGHLGRRWRADAMPECAATPGPASSGADSERTESQAREARQHADTEQAPGPGGDWASTPIHGTRAASLPRSSQPTGRPG